MFAPSAFRPNIEATPVTVTPGTSSSAAVALNRSSHLSALRVVNAGSNTVWLRFGLASVGAVTTSNGIRMLPNSVEVFNLSPTEATHFTHITDVAGNTVQIIEGTGV